MLAEAGSMQYYNGIVMPSQPLPDHYFRGKKIESTQALLYYKGGPIRFEFMEGTRGESVYADFLKRHKAMRLQHIGCHVSDQLPSFPGWRKEASGVYPNGGL